MEEQGEIPAPQPVPELSEEEKRRRRAVKQREEQRQAAIERRRDRLRLAFITFLLTIALVVLFWLGYREPDDRLTCEAPSAMGGTSILAFGYCH